MIVVVYAVSPLTKCALSQTMARTVRKVVYNHHLHGSVVDKLAI